MDLVQSVGAASLDLEQRIGIVRIREADEIQGVERRLGADIRYVSIHDKYVKARDIYDEITKRYQNRPALMWAYDWLPFYLVGLLAIGSTEWLINYDILYRFFGIPALAIGVTLILLLAVALAAHGHGIIIKQGGHRFHDRQYGKRFSDWGLLAISTLCLIIVLCIAGGTRYVTALYDIADTCKPDAFGRVVQCDVHVIRDVVLSLLANVLAWVVGVFFAYLTHDADPDYMDATSEAKKTFRIYRRSRRKADREIIAIQLICAKEIKELQHLYAANKLSLAKV
jgi:hypothetical protein